MQRWGQAPCGRFGETPSDILAELIAGQSPGAGGEGSGDGQGAGGSGGAGGGTGSDGQPFDADRAKRTIDALRDEVKAGKATKTALDDALNRLKAIEDKDKTDSEKLVGDLKSASDKLTAAEQRAAELEARYTNALVSAAIEREAHKGNAVDVEAVAALVDRSEIKVDEAGIVTGADKAVAALLKAKTFLVKTEGGAAGGMKSTPGTSGSAGNPSRDEQVKSKADALRKSGSYTRF